jgi:hypothetical protein
VIYSVERVAAEYRAQLRAHSDEAAALAATAQRFGLAVDTVREAVRLAAQAVTH